jgi:hypothetical protein
MDLYIHTTHRVIFNTITILITPMNNNAIPAKPSVTPIKPVAAEAWPDEVPF